METVADAPARRGRKPSPIKLEQITAALPPGTRRRCQLYATHVLLGGAAEQPAWGDVLRQAVDIGLRALYERSGYPWPEDVAQPLPPTPIEALAAAKPAKPAKAAKPAKSAKGPGAPLKRPSKGRKGGAR